MCFRVFNDAIDIFIYFLLITARQHSLLIVAMQSAVLVTVNPPVCPAVCLSVRLSITRWHYINMTHATIMESSLEDSPMTLVSHRQLQRENPKGT